MDIKELTRLPVANLKKLIKSRAGRIAELEIELKILSAVVDQKVKSGDIGGLEKQEKPIPKKETPKPKDDNTHPKFPGKKTGTLEGDAFEEVD